jgi:hypothetical protein
MYITNVVFNESGQRRADARTPLSDEERDWCEDGECHIYTKL